MIYEYYTFILLIKGLKMIYLSNSNSSRAVISDPEQNVRTPVSYDTRRARGSNRYLHDSRYFYTSYYTVGLKTFFKAILF